MAISMTFHRLDSWRLAARAAHRRSTVWLAMALLPVLLAACSGGGGMRPIGEDGEPNDIDVINHVGGNMLPGQRIASLPVTGEYPMFDRYLIAPGDVLDIVYHLERSDVERFPITLYHQVSVNFVSAPELSETQEVLPDGSISLPFLGPINVVGMTAQELSDVLKEHYSNLLQHPEIYVKIENFNARVEQVREDLHTAGRGLSKLVTVRPDGFANFPIVGSLKVAQRTIEDVQVDLRERYGEFMDGLEADLFMHEQTGTNIFVIGEVNNPGAIQVTRPINVVAALARAGGYTNEGAIKSTIVFRRQGDRMVAHRFNLMDMGRDGAQALNFFLRPDDILLVPRSRISSNAQLMREIMDITMFRGWSFGLDGELFDLTSGGNNDNSRASDLNP